MGKGTGAQQNTQDGMGKGLGAQQGTNGGTSQ
jgi:hypothetical protein